MFLLIRNNSLIKSFAGAFWWTKLSPQYMISRSSKDTTLSTHMTGLGTGAQLEWHTHKDVLSKNPQFSSKIDVIAIRTPVFMFHFSGFFFFLSIPALFAFQFISWVNVCEGTGERHRTTFGSLLTFPLLWQGPTCFCCCVFHLLG